MGRHMNTVEQTKHNGLGAYRCMNSAMGVVSAIDAPCVGATA